MLWLMVHVYQLLLVSYLKPSKSVSIYHEIIFLNDYIDQFSGTDFNAYIIESPIENNHGLLSDFINCISIIREIDHMTNDRVIIIGVYSITQTIWLFFK